MPNLVCTKKNNKIILYKVQNVTFSDYLSVNRKKIVSKCVCISQSFIGFLVVSS